MSDSIWSGTLSGSSGSSSQSSFSGGGTTSEGYGYEKVNAEAVYKNIKNTTESILQTLKADHAAEAHFMDLNLKLAEKVSDQFSKIELAKSLLDARIAEIESKFPSVIEYPAMKGLLNRHKFVKEKLVFRQAKLKQIAEAAKEYLHKSNVGELSDTIEETHNRLLILQKEINGGNELEEKLESIALLLEKFSTLSFHGINAAAGSESYEASLEKIEREEMFNDTLRQIRHFCETIKKAKNEPITEVTIAGSSSSQSIESLSDF